MATEKWLIPLSKRIVYAGDVFNSLMSEKGWSVTEASDFMKVFRVVDAVEVVHGRWERLGEADYKCSECGFRFTSGDPISMFLFCRCGAKMDKETKFVGICERCEYRDECDWPKLHPKIELKKCPDFNEGEKNKNG